MFRLALIDALGDWSVIRGLLDADEAVASSLIVFLCSPPPWTSDTAPAAKQVGVIAGRAALDAGCAEPLLRLAAKRTPKALTAFLSAVAQGSSAHVSALLRESGAVLVNAIKGALADQSAGDEGGPLRTTRRAAAMDAVVNIATTVYSGADACVEGVTIRAGDRLANAIDAWGLFTAVAHAAEAEQGALARLSLDLRGDDILEQAVAAVVERAKRVLAERVKLRQEKSEKGWLQRFGASQSSAQAAREVAREMVAAAVVAGRGAESSSGAPAVRVAVVRIGEGGDLRLAPLARAAGIKLPPLKGVRAAA